MSDHPLKRLLQKITGQDVEATAMRESLEEVIEESDRESPALSAQERVMLGNLLRFADLKVHHVMVPRTEIVGVAAGTPRDEILELLARTGHTRLPVYRSNMDDIAGILYVNDLLRPLDRGGAIKGDKLDVFFPTHEEALAWGRKMVPVTVLN